MNKLSYTNQDYRIPLLTLTPQYSEGQYAYTRTFQSLLSTTCCIPSSLTPETMLISCHRNMTCDQPPVIAILYQDSLS